MSWQGRSTYKPRPRGSLQFPELIGLMLISPSDEEPQEEKPPTESQDSTHGQEREEDQDAAEIQSISVWTQEKVQFSETG
uniref:GAGE domain-containing protein n=1 Tax=Theropithecus gelada TaxID=9565 RepID=A0A8D2E7T3_THEGE